MVAKFIISVPGAPRLATGEGGAPAPKKQKSAATAGSSAGKSKLKRVPSMEAPAGVKSPFAGAEIRSTHEFSGGQKLQVIAGNLVRAAADCIVNSSHPTMRHTKHQGLCQIIASEAGIPHL